MNFRSFATVLLIAFSIPALAQVPTITSFSPQSGPVGTSVTINGSGFSATAASNLVFFGTGRAVVTAATATQLTVTAPAGESQLPLSVLVNGRVGYAAKPFAITFPGGETISQQSFKPYLDFQYSLATYAVDDLDGDGKNDLAFSDWDDGSISAVKIDAAPGKLKRTAFSDPVSITAATDTRNKVFSVDFDGDGAKDLLQSGFPSLTILVSRNLGGTGITTGSFAAPITLATLQPAYEVAYADFDRDGRIDIVAITTDITSYYLTIFQNTSTPGSISFATRVDRLNSDGLLTLATGDIDGDGMPEILSGNTSRLLSVFKNKMTGPGTITTTSFDDAFSIFSNDYAQSIVVGDVDMDGKNDVIVSSQRW